MLDMRKMTSYLFGFHQRHCLYMGILTGTASSLALTFLIKLTHIFKKVFDFSPLLRKIKVNSTDFQKR